MLAVLAIDSTAHDIRADQDLGIQSADLLALVDLILLLDDTWRHFWIARYVTVSMINAKCIKEKQNKARKKIKGKLPSVCRLELQGKDVHGPFSPSLACFTLQQDKIRSSDFKLSSFTLLSSSNA